MLRRVLPDKAEALLAEERRLLSETGQALAAFGATAEDRAALDRSVAQLDELFLLVVAGEFNAGKSAFINALLGRQVLEEGVTPTTASIHLLRWGEQEERTPGGAAYEVVTAPIELLREINIVDTPGTNAIRREHEAITREFIPRSDLVLFVTSADRPFTESERQFLGGIREWGKKVVVVVNKVDILESEEDRARVREFVATGARDLLGAEPEIFLVSARQAFRAKTGPAEERDERLAASGFQPLEDFVVDTLDEGERLRLKLGNPVGVGRRLAAKYRELIDGRLGLLAADVATLEDIERQIAAYREDMEREFRYRLSDIENVLHEFETRGTAFFDETLRIGRVFDLINKEKVRGEFEREVIADVPQVIETRVSELIDWLVAAELRQWQAVTQHAARRREHHGDRIVGEPGTFEYDRDHLLATVGRTARRTVESYDRSSEAARMAESVQTAVASAAVLEVGAIGLGATVAFIATSTAIDVTGILAASALAIIGLFIIPNRRRAAKAELSERIERMRESLLAGLTGQFEREMEKSLARLREAIAPYTRFVRSEREHLTDHGDRLAGLDGRLAEVETAVARL